MSVLLLTIIRYTFCSIYISALFGEIKPHFTHKAYTLVVWITNETVLIFAIYTTVVDQSEPNKALNTYGCVIGAIQTKLNWTSLTTAPIDNCPFGTNTWSISQFQKTIIAESTIVFILTLFAIGGTLFTSLVDAEVVIVHALIAVDIAHTQQTVILSILALANCVNSKQWTQQNQQFPQRWSTHGQ